jgi:hypothetical protein
MSGLSCVATASTAEPPRVSEELATELAQSEMAFDPALLGEFSVVPVERNLQFKHHFALRHNKLPIELRYAIHRLPANMASNALRTYAYTCVVNMATKGADKHQMGAGIVYTRNFPPAAAKAEINADWGLTSVFDPDPTFAKYDYGQVVIIARDSSKVLGFWIYLTNAETSNTDEFRQLIGRTFPALRFKT